MPTPTDNAIRLLRDLEEVGVRPTSFEFRPRTNRVALIFWQTDYNDHDLTTIKRLFGPFEVQIVGENCWLTRAFVHPDYDLTIDATLFGALTCEITSTEVVTERITDADRLDMHNKIQDLQEALRVGVRNRAVHTYDCKPTQ
jgi:hypothetical protein